MKKLEKYIDEAIKNIRTDRDVTRRLLDDVMIYLSKSDERHREVGITAAKYVETPEYKASLEKCSGEKN